MASENAVNDLGAQNKSILVVDDTVVETRRLQSKTVGGKNYLLVTNDNSLVPFVYDYISLAYTGENLTSVVYKTGGSSGTIVATLTLGYSGSNLTSVTRT